MASPAKMEEVAKPLHLPRLDMIQHSDEMDRIIADAKRATEKERHMSLWEGVKLYPKAIGWSVVISTCIVMEGYDIALVNNFCRHLLHVCLSVSLARLMAR